MWRDSITLRWNYHLLASPGYVVLLTDYRGSTGYGEAFTLDILGDPLRGPADDVNQAADEAIRRYPFIDATRQAAGGASYGGHLANWLEATTTRYRCLVSHAGLASLESQWATSDSIHHRELMMGGPFWEKPDAWRDQSPVAYAKSFRTPMLLSVGENDYRVPVNNTLEMYAVLSRMKVPARLLVWPDENHWIQKGENSRVFYREVARLAGPLAEVKHAAAPLLRRPLGETGRPFLRRGRPRNERACRAHQDDERGREAHHDPPGPVRPSVPEHQQHREGERLAERLVQAEQLVADRDPGVDHSLDRSGGRACGREDDEADEQPPQRQPAALTLEEDVAEREQAGGEHQPAEHLQRRSEGDPLRAGRQHVAGEVRRGEGLLVVGQVEGEHAGHEVGDHVTGRHAQEEARETRFAHRSSGAAEAYASARRSVRFRPWPVLAPAPPRRR